MLPSYPKKEFKKRDDLVDFGFNDCLELNVPRIARRSIPTIQTLTVKYNFLPLPMGCGLPVAIFAATPQKHRPRRQPRRWQHKVLTERATSGNVPRLAEVVEPYNLYLNVVVIITVRSQSKKVRR